MADDATSSIITNWPPEGLGLAQARQRMPAYVRASDAQKTGTAIQHPNRAAFEAAVQDLYGRAEKELRERLEDSVLFLVGYQAEHPDQPVWFDSQTIRSLQFDFDGDVVQLFNGTVYLSCRIHSRKSPKPAPPPLVIKQNRSGKKEPAYYADIRRAAAELFPAGYERERPTVVIYKVSKATGHNRDAIQRALGLRKD
jgi:hypothetical protein